MKNLIECILFGSWILFSIELDNRTGPVQHKIKICNSNAENNRYANYIIIIAKYNKKVWNYLQKIV